MNNFKFGEHTIVVVQGFEDAHEVVLEVLTNGNLVASQTFPIKSGHVEKTSLTSESMQASPLGGWVKQETWTVEINAGIKVDMGALPPGSYDLALKTNSVIAATSHFDVTLRPDMEQERQAIESERRRLDEAEKAMKELKAELEHEKSLLDLSNPALVSAFNNKSHHYNEQLTQAQADQEKFNTRVAAFNARLSGFGLIQ